jgi:hypothetical protein
VHDRHAGGPGGVEHPLGVGQHAGLVHDLFDRAVQDATLGGEVVLVLDQHDGGGLGIDRHAASSSRCGAKTRIPHRPSLATDQAVHEGSRPAKARRRSIVGAGSHNRAASRRSPDTPATTSPPVLDGKITRRACRVALRGSPICRCPTTPQSQALAHVAPPSISRFSMLPTSYIWTLVQRRCEVDVNAPR